MQEEPADVEVVVTLNDRGHRFESLTAMLFVGVLMNDEILRRRRSWYMRCWLPILKY